MKRYLITAVLMLILVSPSLSAYAKERKLTWSGCGVSKKAFMKELGKGYEKKTGIKVRAIASKFLKKQSVT